MKVSIFVENLDKFESFLKEKILEDCLYAFRFTKSGSGIEIVAHCSNTKIDEEKIKKIKALFGTEHIEIYD